MSVTDWFSQRERRRYTRTGGGQGRPGPSEVADGIWVQCPGCKRALLERELAEKVRVCSGCGHHFAMTPTERIASLVDDGTFTEIDASLTPRDPLGFVAVKSYAESLSAAREKSGANEAVLTGRAAIAGAGVVLGVMDFRFIGASMGSVVGERVTRAFELATEERLPAVMVTASGGARMQEGMLSLMQMAKTSAAVRRHSDAGLPYLSILTNPTYGGVTASFAVLADVIFAEPGAMIGFAGPRLVEQTIRQKLPKGFQTSESMLKHGMIDRIVARTELRDTVALMLSYLTPRAGGGAGV